MNDERGGDDKRPAAPKGEYYRGEHKISPALRAKLAQIRERRAATDPKKNAAQVIRKQLIAEPKSFKQSPVLEAKLEAYRLKQERRKRHEAILVIADCAIGGALTRDQRVIEEREIADKVAQHIIALRRELRNSVTFDPYGGVERDGRVAEIQRFLGSVGFDRNKFHIKRAIMIVWREFYRLEKARQMLGFDPESYPNDGHAFEEWVASSLRTFGWKAQVTPGSGDQGVDVIATRGDISVAIQVKCYTGKVGNAAVQEVFSGAAHLGVQHAVVIATGGFTPSAMQLSQTTGVYLLDVSEIPDLEAILTKTSRSTASSSA